MKITLPIMCHKTFYNTDKMRKCPLPIVFFKNLKIRVRGDASSSSGLNYWIIIREVIYTIAAHLMHSINYCLCFNLYLHFLKYT